MKSIALIVVILLTSLCLFAQPNPDTLWTRTYGGSGNEDARSVVQTSDGGYIIVGQTNTYGHGGYDVYVVKIDPSGNVQWDRPYGGSQDDNGVAVVQTSDGGFAVLGNTKSYGYGYNGYADIYLLRLNAAGDTLWTRTFGGSEPNDASTIQATSDGGLIIGAQFQTYNWQLHLIKTTGSGDVLRSRVYAWASPYNYTDCGEIRQTFDGGFIICGMTDAIGHGNHDLYALKTDSNLDSQWVRTYGGSGEDGGRSVALTSDSGYTFAGYTLESYGHGSYDYWLLRTNRLGDTLWTRIYGGGIADLSEALVATSDGGCAVAGRTQSFGHGFTNDIWLLRTDSGGDSLWSRQYGGTNDEFCYSVYRTSDYGYVLAGSTRMVDGTTDMYVVKTGPDPRVWITKPNGGENWRILTQDTIRWSSIAYTGRVRLELNRNYPAGIWGILVDSTGNDGFEVITASGPPSVHCRVRISARTQSISADVSDADFTISSSQGYLTLASISQPEIPVTTWNAGTKECPDSATVYFHLKNFGSENIVVFQPLEPSSMQYSRTTNCPAFFSLAPNQMSACSLRLSYNPQNEATHRDTLYIQSDAVNAVNGYVRIPLVGKQIRTPQTPQVVITTDGEDAVLHWNRITQSIGGCPITVTRYLVFYSPTMAGPYYYHGYTADTMYTHLGVIEYAIGMFYNVRVITAPPAFFALLPSEPSNTLTEDQVLEILQQAMLVNN